MIPHTARRMTCYYYIPRTIPDSDSRSSPAKSFCARALWIDYFKRKPTHLKLDNGVPSFQDLPSPVATRARTPGFYKELSSSDQIPPPPSGGDAAVNSPELLYCLSHDTPDRVTRHLVRNSPLKQKLVLLLGLLGLDKLSVDDSPEQDTHLSR
jgi:hypothetical protein